MTTVFEVQSEHIVQLSDIQLTSLLKRLLLLETNAHGIYRNAVDVALNITVADGGEDGRVTWQAVR